MGVSRTAVEVSTTAVGLSRTGSPVFPSEVAVHVVHVIHCCCSCMH